MNKFDEIYNKIILEARRRDLEYAEKKDKKTGALKEVLVEVEGVDSGVITKQINIIKEAKEKADEAAKIYEEHKERVIEYMPDFFVEADKFATRIIKTKSGVIKFHKFIEAGVKVEESTDVDSVKALLKDLMDLIKEQASEIAEKAEELITNADVIKTKTKEVKEQQRIAVEGVVKETADKIFRGFIKLIKAAGRGLKSLVEKLTLRQEKIDEKLVELKKLTK